MFRVGPYNPICTLKRVRFLVASGNIHYRWAGIRGKAGSA